MWDSNRLRGWEKMTTVASILLTLQKYPAQNAPKFAILLKYKSTTHCHGIFSFPFWYHTFSPLITHHIINWSDWAMYVNVMLSSTSISLSESLEKWWLDGLETESLINGYRFSWNVNFSIISHTYYLVPVSSVHLWYLDQ